MTRAAVTYARPEGTPLTPCRKCNARIFFATTGSGKSMPCNEDGTPHWATCPSAETFRRPKPKPDVFVDPATGELLEEMDPHPGAVAGQDSSDYSAPKPPPTAPPCKVLDMDPTGELFGFDHPFPIRLNGSADETRRKYIGRLNELAALLVAMRGEKDAAPDLKALAHGFDFCWGDLEGVVSRGKALRLMVERAERETRNAQRKAE